MIKYRKSIGAVVFIRTRSGVKFLILHRIKNWTGWELIKGGIKDGEALRTTLKREVREETGLKTFKIIGPVGYTIRYAWPKHLRKDHHIYSGAEAKFFLVEALSDKIRVSKREHDKYRWVTKTQALKLLTYQDNRVALRRAAKKYSDLK